MTFGKVRYARLAKGLRSFEIGENEAISLQDFANLDADGLPEARAVVHKRMELAVFAARVDAGRQVGQELGVEITAGEFGGEHIRVDACDFRAEAGSDHGRGQLGRNRRGCL